MITPARNKFRFSDFLREPAAQDEVPVYFDAWENVIDPRYYTASFVATIYSTEYIKKRSCTYLRPIDHIHGPCDIRKFFYDVGACPETIPGPSHRRRRLLVAVSADQEPLVLRCSIECCSKVDAPCEIMFTWLEDKDRRKVAFTLQELGDVFLLIMSIPVVESYQY
ncbi:hypothetical protein M405DRAFT_883310 [Rhizopogon salebrosus TDB-379]|nr:hypothetical protein M405DRAFT_883310 [Rhizopogon salebrosus TDB-379]